MSDKTDDVRQAVRDELERDRDNTHSPDFVTAFERMSRGYTENDAARQKAEKEKQG